MDNFSYTLVDPSGRKKNGVIEAASKDAAVQRLTAEGQFLLNIEPIASKTGAGSHGPVTEKRTKSVNRSDLALFTRRLSDLAMAGLPLDRVLQVVAEQSESSTLAHVAESALAEVRTGKPVSEALAEHPKYFPQVFTQTLRAGEASGQFGEVAARLADFQELEVARRSAIASAMVYPALLSFSALGVVAFLMLYVVPTLSGVFAKMKGDLPASTKALIAISTFITTNYILIFGGLIAAFVIYRTWVATEAGAYAKDRFMLQLPGAGSVVRKSVVSRYARVLGTLVFGGVPILDALNLAGLASGNRFFQRNSETVQAEVREGRTIHDAMRDTGAFPPVLTHMVAIGEETGDLPKMLGRVADSLDFEVDTGLKRLTALVEPLIVLFMGGVVGFVVLSILLPIFNAQDLVK